MLDDFLYGAVLCNELPGGLVADAGDAGNVVARVALEADEVRNLVRANAVAELDALRRVDVHVRDAARRHHQRDVVGDELERVTVRRDDARLDPRLVRPRRERGDDVVRLPALELEVPVAEGLDDRAEVRELLAEEVRHRPALRLVVRGQLRAVDGPRVPGDRNAPGRVVGEQLEEHVREPEERVRRLPVGRLELLGKREERAVGEVVAVDEEELGVANGRVVELELLSRQRLRHDATLVGRASASLPVLGHSAGWIDAVRRVPLLSGSRVVLVPAGDEDVVLRPPAEPRQVVDVAAAVRDALRYPLSGSPLEAVTPRGGRATIVVEPAALPLPGAPQDARQTAIAVAIAELERCGIPDERQTLLVAGGLGRRFGQHDLERLLSPPQARSFRGRVVVHDAEDESLAPIDDGIRVSPALVETDLVLTVTAAETILHGGPGACVAACDAETVRAVAGADSLLEASGSSAWDLALRIETALAERVELAGVSLVLDLPRLTGRYRGYPND